MAQNKKTEINGIVYVIGSKVNTWGITGRFTYSKERLKMKFNLMKILKVGE